MSKKKTEINVTAEDLWDCIETIESPNTRHLNKNYISCLTPQNMKALWCREGPLALLPLSRVSKSRDGTSLSDGREEYVPLFAKAVFKFFTRPEIWSPGVEDEFLSGIFWTTVEKTYLHVPQYKVLTMDVTGVVSNSEYLTRVSKSQPLEWPIEFGYLCQDIARTYKSLDLLAKNENRQTISRILNNIITVKQMVECPSTPLSPLIEFRQSLQGLLPVKLLLEWSVVRGFIEPLVMKQAILSASSQDNDSAVASLGVGSKENEVFGEFLNKIDGLMLSAGMECLDSQKEIKISAL